MSTKLVFKNPFEIGAADEQEAAELKLRCDLLINLRDFLGDIDLNFDLKPDINAHVVEDIMELRLEKFTVGSVINLLLEAIAVTRPPLRNVV